MVVGRGSGGRVRLLGGGGRLGGVVATATAVEDL